VKIGFEEGKNIYYATGGGTIEVNNNKILILADSIEAVENIDAERARRAKERALEYLQKRGEQNIDIPRAEEALKRAVNRLNLVEKRIRSEV
jgi:F-type H+-transporting ATPase subunit epsilon